MANYSLQEAFKELNPLWEDQNQVKVNNLNAAKKAGYTEVQRGKWRDLEHNVPAKYFNVALPKPRYNDVYDVQIRTNYATNPANGQKIAIPEYRAVWATTNSYGDYGYASKVIKPEQVNLGQFRTDRSNAARDKETAEYTKKLNEFNVDNYLNMKGVEEALDEIAKHIDIDPAVREDILKRAEEAIGGPTDWCTVVVLTDQYADNNPNEHSRISRKGMSKEDAFYDAQYSNEPVYKQLNAWCAWHYDYMKTKDADEFLAKQIQRENDIHAGKIKVEHR